MHALPRDPAGATVGRRRRAHAIASATTSSAGTNTATGTRRTSGIRDTADACSHTSARAAAYNRHADDGGNHAPGNDAPGNDVPGASV